MSDIADTFLSSMVVLTPSGQFLDCTTTTFSERLYLINEIICCSKIFWGFYSWRIWDIQTRDFMKNTDHIVQVGTTEVLNTDRVVKGRYFNVLNIEHVVRVDTSTC